MYACIATQLQIPEQEVAVRMCSEAYQRACMYACTATQLQIPEQEVAVRMCSEAY